MSPEAVGQKTLKSIEFLSSHIYFLHFLRELFRKGNARNEPCCEWFSSSKRFALSGEAVGIENAI